MERPCICWTETRRLHRSKGMIKGYIISMIGDFESESATRQLITSIQRTQSQIDPIIFPATTPDTLGTDLKKIDSFDATNLQYTYPQVGERLDISTGLKLKAYETGNIKNRIACMVSHMRLWEECIDREEEIIILEHDAVFTRQFVGQNIWESSGYRGGVVGLNDPRGMTRKSQIYHDLVSKQEGVQDVPYVDDNKDYPQGLAGNSAYIMTPLIASKLLHNVEEFGMWPNDALMCKQLFPTLQVVYPYYTTIQKGLRSTTTS